MNCWMSMWTVMGMVCICLAVIAIMKTIMAPIMRVIIWHFQVYALHAYQEHWGYVWGTFGLVLTEGLFESKLAQYPDALAGNADFIRQTWVGGRTTDCVGLIKGYGWLDAETEEIVYNTNGMPDITANEMYHSATVSGPIDTIPETPGLAVWHDGHIGVYIGNGEVVEAMGTRYGVVKTKLEGARWTHWLKIPYISYD